MATLFEAYVTNAGKYSEGQLVGETLKFPTTAQEVEALLKRIGVDGVRYQEIFITSFDGDVLGLYDHLSEYENLDELNHLACLLSELRTPFRYIYFWVVGSKDNDLFAAGAVFCVRLHAPTVNRFRFRPGIEFTVRAVITLEFAYFFFIHRLFTS